MPARGAGRRAALGTGHDRTAVAGALVLRRLDAAARSAARVVGPGGHRGERGRAPAAGGLAAASGRRSCRIADVRTARDGAGTRRPGRHSPAEDVLPPATPLSTLRDGGIG